MSPQRRLNAGWWIENREWWIQNPEWWNQSVDPKLNDIQWMWLEKPKETARPADCLIGGSGPVCPIMLLMKMTKKTKNKRNLHTNSTWISWSTTALTSQLRFQWIWKFEFEKASRTPSLELLLFWKTAVRSCGKPSKSPYLVQILKGALLRLGSFNLWLISLKDDNWQD